MRILAVLALTLAVLPVCFSAEGEAAVTQLDDETRARAEAAADRFLAGDAGAVAMQAAEAERMRARELGELTDDQQALITTLDGALTQAENFMAAGDGKRAGDGFLTARNQLSELEEGLKDQLPTTLPWLEKRVSALALKLLDAPDLAVPESENETARQAPTP